MCVCIIDVFHGLPYISRNDLRTLGLIARKHGSYYAYDSWSSTVGQLCNNASSSHACTLAVWKKNGRKRKYMMTTCGVPDAHESCMLIGSCQLPADNMIASPGPFSRLNHSGVGAVIKGLLYLLFEYSCH